MKKKLAVVLSALIVLSAVAFTGSALSKPTVAEKQNQNPVTENKSTEIAKISLDDAIDLALADAGVKREDALFHASPELDRDEKNQHYDVEFYSNGVEYDYEVAVADGAILKAEKEREKVPTTTQKKVEEKEPQKVKEKEAEKKNEKPTEAPTLSKKNPEASHISIEQAKEAALLNAGKKAADVQFKKAVYDIDDLVAHYDIKFVADGYEYEYEVKAADGKILEKDVDKIHTSVAPTKQEKPQNNNYIAKEKALEAAVAHAKVDSAQVKFSKVELDRDDLIVHYDVEFVSGAYEYEYEINAETGKVVTFDKERND